MALTKIGTDGVKDDAVTSDKVANSINSAIAANTAKTQTTINNNADNRVITGSGTANTLNGESNVVIDSSGKLGIGTTSPQRKLHVREDNTPCAKFGGEGGSAYYIEVGQVGSSSSGGFNATGYATSMLFQINGSEKLRLQSTGGLSFNGDAAAANALDDYEEGTWTPTVSSGFNNVQYETNGRQGGYTKIGRYVFITMTIHMGGTTSTTSSGIQITGLPFTAKSFSHDNTQSGGLNIIYHDGFSSQTQGLIQDGTSRIDLVRFDGSGSLTGTSVNAGREFRMAGSYMT